MARSWNEDPWGRVLVSRSFGGSLVSPGPVAVAAISPVVSVVGIGPATGEALQRRRQCPENSAHLDDSLLAVAHRTISTSELAHENPSSNGCDCGSGCPAALSCAGAFAPSGSPFRSHLPAPRAAVSEKLLPIQAPSHLITAWETGVIDRFPTSGGDVPAGYSHHPDCPR